MIEWLHPGLILIAGAVLVPFIRGTARKVFLVALACAALADCLLMSPGRFGAVSFLNQSLTFGRVDRLSLVFGYIFSTMSLIGVIYALHVKEAGQHAAALVYAGSALGAVFAGDFIVLFIFWELMSFSSVCLVWYGRTGKSLASGFRYLLMHVFGGACLLTGIVLHVHSTGSIAFEGMSGRNLGGALILAGFILNAAVPPLSAWLTDAYPEASVTGAVFMSAFTTKTAVYVLARGYSGSVALLWLGAFMALYGVIYAVLQNDARRLLAYHIVSQVGYMVCGIGLGSALSVNGAVAHAFTIIINKALLFMGAGAVLEMTGRRKLSEMGGLYRTMPLTLGLYMVGALSISALPLTSGFVSKSMVTAGAGEAGQTVIFLMLTAASAGTFLSVGLKLPYYMFFGKDTGIEAGEPPRNMLAAMGMAALICVFIGVFPGSLYSVLPHDSDFAPYTLQHLISTLELLLLTAVAFLALKTVIAPKPAVALDTDWFYRRGARALMWLVRKPLSAWEFGMVDAAHLSILKTVARAAPLLESADGKVIDRTVDGLGRGALAWGNAMRGLQNGRWHRYALVMVLGVALMLAWILLSR